jgi:membrane glycosyltransferase
MVDQDLSVRFTDPGATDVQQAPGTSLWRWTTFGSSAGLTLTVVALFTDFFRMGGVSGFEAVLIGLIAFSFFWIALAVSAALTGLAHGLLRRRSVETRQAAPLSVALLVPMHNEDPVDVMGNAWAMMDALSEKQMAHRFSLCLLSDTKDAESVEAELKTFADLRLACPGAAIYYRSFPENTERKIGNLSQWIRTWGGGHDAMIVLDADSLMSADAIGTLADALASDPSAGLIQSTPRLFGTQTLFGRVQQFGNAVYGGLLGAGLAAWSGADGNYWGHNAIIRMRAFAAAAGLPRLGRKQGLILSHDFVEAALLRRAGWGVRVIPNMPGSYEEAPRNIIDFALRDRRWCRDPARHAPTDRTRRDNSCLDAVTISSSSRSGPARCPPSHR